MKQNLINDVVRNMLPYLNNAQIEKLQAVMQHTLFSYDVAENENKDASFEQDLMELFLSAKRIEGCSEKSLKYYQATIKAMIAGVGKKIKHITTEFCVNSKSDIRHMNNYQRAEPIF